jgi:gamma-glutamylcyclotransferase (GGCT)/AIG2-like uncharacterized protein YtfP
LQKVVDLLFVYGTLRSEFTNRYAVFLRAHGERVRVAEVIGAIYRIAHYPGFKPKSKGIVRGELYRLRNPAATLEVLDRYEGEEFRRVTINLPEAAWIYEFIGLAPEDARIESGDFCG